MIDVLVVGGGPVGLATAIRCAQQGLSVTVAEPRPVPVDKACGEGVMPAAVRRLAALGVVPDGHPLRGIRYLDARHRADAPFRHGHGLGVRRTVLHAALAERAAALGIPVLPVRVTDFDRRAEYVAAAGVEARYLVAADGLHSAIRRLLDRGSPAGDVPRGGARNPAPPRYGLRRHYHVAPWTDLVEVHWARGAEAYVTPVSPDVVGVAILFSKPHPTALGPSGPRTRASSGTAGPSSTSAGAQRALASRGAALRATAATGSTAGLSAATATTSDATTSSGASGAMVGAWPASDGASRGADRGTRETTGADGDFEARLAAFPALLDRLGGGLPASEVRGAGPLRHDVGRRVHGRVLLVGDASGYLDALTGEGIGVGLAQADVLARCLAADRPDEYERAWRRVSGPAWRFTASVLWSRNQPVLAPRIVPAAQRLPWLFSALVNHAAQA